MDSNFPTTNNVMFLIKPVKVLSRVHQNTEILKSVYNTTGRKELDYFRNHMVNLGLVIILKEPKIKDHFL